MSSFLIKPRERNKFFICSCIYFLCNNLLEDFLGRKGYSQIYTSKKSQQYGDLIILNLITYGYPIKQISDQIRIQNRSKRHIEWNVIKTSRNLTSCFIEELVTQLFVHPMQKIGSCLSEICVCTHAFSISQQRSICK